MNTSAWLLILFAVTGLSLSGCASKKYKYEPLESNQTAACIGNAQDVAEYPIPLHSEKGEVKIESLGISDLSPTEDLPKAHVLQIRMTIVNNQKAGQWSLRPNDQVVVFENRNELKPAWVRSDTQTSAEVVIKAAETRVVHMFYELPKELEKADQVPAFNFAWTLLTPAGTEAAKTKFQRTEVTPQVAGSGFYPGVGFGYGWGPIWYYPR